jgi:hypothetical protein
MTHYPLLKQSDIRILGQQATSESKASLYFQLNPKYTKRHPKGTRHSRLGENTELQINNQTKGFSISIDVEVTFVLWRFCI